MPAEPLLPATCAEYAPTPSVVTRAASFAPTVRGNAPTDVMTAASADNQLSFVAATTVDEFGPRMVSNGSANAPPTPKADSAGPIPRTTSVLLSPPVMTNP